MRFSQHKATARLKRSDLSYFPWNAQTGDMQVAITQGVKMIRHPPATGMCRWLDDLANGNRVLEINGETYEIEVKDKGGFNLYKGDDVCYQINTTFGCGVWTCDCPDANYRRIHCCKHIRALRAALKALPF